MPGETIPTFVPDSPIASSTPTQHTTSSASIAQQNLVELLQALQSGVETQLSSVVSSLDKVSERMTRLESQQMLLEEVKEASNKVTASSSPRKPGKRRRNVPTALQVHVQ